ncbi:TonB-like protein [Novosphingobium sp. ST904]|nr:TonB-like protein [Novosphingobium sp. ST904]
MFGIIGQSLLLATAQAAAPAAAAPASAPATLQQQFDAASDAAQDGKCSDAITAFEALEHNPAAMKSPVVRGAIGVRKGNCLVKLHRTDEGEAAIRSGLPAMVAAGEVFVGDVVNAHMGLGTAARDRFDYARAGDEFRLALAAGGPQGRFRPLLALSQVSIFDPGPEPLAYIDEASRIADATPSISKDFHAQLLTLKARILLNRGEKAEGYALLKDALKLQGGLSLKVSLSDVATRSDLAIAAMLLNKRDDARNYLVYTGAGRMDQAPFSRAENMDVPLCGSTSGLTPADYAVVEFSIADDGSAFGVQPIYSTGGREIALAFARAASRWSWAPAKVQEIKPFLRYAMRVEMRCTVAGARPQINEPLTSRFMQWAAPLLAGRTQGGTDGAVAARASALLDQSRKEGTDQLTVALLGMLGLNPVTDTASANTYLQEGLGLALSRNMPVETSNWLRFAIAAQRNSDKPAATRAALRELLPVVTATGDALAIDTVRLQIASPGYRLSAPVDAPTLREAVIADPALPRDHPLKINALLQSASWAAQNRDFSQAQQIFQQTGLSTEQCAFIGAAPAIRRTGVSSTDYPMEAARMGFEGWTRVEFDVDSAGRTRQQRALISYPPFVFSDAASAMAKDFVYESSYRPGGDTACAGAAQNIAFRMN